MTVNTLYGQRVQLLSEHNIPYTSVEGTTLNEKVNVNPYYGGYAPYKYPKRRYIGVGIGGHKQVLNPHGVLIERHNLFEPYYTQLFNHAPFVIRTVANDLPLEDKLKYRMRAVLEIDGIQYVAYYLRLIEDLDSDVTATTINTVGGVITTTPFVPDVKYQSILDHQLRTLTTFDHETKAYESLVVSLTGSITLSVSEVNDLITSIGILYGADPAPIISEIGIFAGIETTSNPILPTDTYSYLEADQVVLSSYTPIHHQLIAGASYKLNIDVGPLGLLSRSIPYV